MSSADAIQMQAQIFDSIRPMGAKLFLLKKAEQTKRLTVVAEIQTGWFTVFDREYRDEMKASIATAADISDHVAQSSFLGYGIGEPGDELDVFSYSNEKKDATRPNATSPSWKIHCKRDPALRFRIP